MRLREERWRVILVDFSLKFGLVPHFSYASTFRIFTKGTRSIIAALSDEYLKELKCRSLSNWYQHLEWLRYSECMRCAVIIIVSDRKGF